jgi:hypothetical protein
VGIDAVVPASSQMTNVNRGRGMGKILRQEDVV